MIRIEHIEAFNFEAAIRGMRNPKNSWDKSDSGIVVLNEDDVELGYEPMREYRIGKNDLDLMKRLYKAGTEHRTYARMIQVSMDITAPLYWWKEMDRYTIGKSQVSCSTMHKIHAKEFELDDFSHEHLSYEDNCLYFLGQTVDVLNQCRDLYLETKDKKWWWQMIQLLPSSYNQKRTICMSYETVFKIIRERSGHKLTEWEDFCIILKELPYIKEIMEV